MPRNEPQRVLAELEQLGLQADRLAEFAPAIRGTLQSVRRDRERALRACNLVLAEDWRRVSVAAGRLLAKVDQA